MLDVETEAIDNLRPYHRNPRSHRNSVEHVMESIEKYGFRVPVVIDSENTIVAGHGRFKATQKLKGRLDDRIQELRLDGRDTLADNLEVINDGRIFVIRDDELDKHTIAEFRITDNRITELSEWNEDLLKSELQNLDAEPAGFTQDELADMLPDYELDIDDDDDEEEDDDSSSGLIPETGNTGVELICPSCLEEFQLSAELVRLELDMLGGSDDEDTEAEA